MRTRHTFLNLSQTTCFWASEKKKRNETEMIWMISLSTTSFESFDVVHTSSKKRMSSRKKTLSQTKLFSILLLINLAFASPKVVTSKNDHHSYWFTAEWILQNIQRGSQMLMIGLHPKVRPFCSITSIYRSYSKLFANPPCYVSFLFFIRSRKMTQSADMEQTNYAQISWSIPRLHQSPLEINTTGKVTTNDRLPNTILFRSRKLHWDSQQDTFVFLCSAAISLLSLSPVRLALLSLSLRSPNPLFSPLSPWIVGATVFSGLPKPFQPSLPKRLGDGSSTANAISFDRNIEVAPIHPKI